MSDVTQILEQIEAGDPSAAEQLLPLVYEERRVSVNPVLLRGSKIPREPPARNLDE